MGWHRREAGLLAVAHDLIRRELLRSTPAARARHVHRRLGAWLSSTAGHDEQLLFAAIDHLRQAGSPVLDLAVHLAGSSRRRLLGIDGLAQLSAILDDAPLGDRHAAMLRERLATLAAELGQYEEALRRWSEHASAAEDPITAARAALGASDAAMALGLAHDAWSHWEQASAHADRDATLAVEVRAHEAELHWFLEHRSSEARASAEAALAAGRALAGRAGDVDVLDRSVRRALLAALGAATDKHALNVGDIEAMLEFAGERASLAAVIDERVHVGALVDVALAWHARAQRRGRHQAATVVGAGPRAGPAPGDTAGRRDAGGHTAVGRGSSMRRMRWRRSAQHSARAWSSSGRRGRSPCHCRISSNCSRGLASSDRRADAPRLRQRRIRTTGYTPTRSVLPPWPRLNPHGAADEAHEAVSDTLRDAEQARCERCMAEVTARGAEALADRRCLGRGAAPRSVRNPSVR